MSRLSRLNIAPPEPETPEPAPTPVEVPETPRESASRRLPAAPARSEAPLNLHLPSEGFVDLNFKVEPELRQRFKMEAVRRGMSNKEFLSACFQVYMETYPSEAGIVELREPTTEQRRHRIELRKQRAARMAKIRSRGRP